MNNFFDTPLEFAALSIAAVSGSIAIIALLRPVVRRLGGAVAMLQLWWILPLSLVALFFPKTTAERVWTETTPLVLHSVSTTVAVAPANPFPLGMFLLVIWGAGVFAMTMWLFTNHLRFLRIVTWKPNGRGTTPASTGPAVIGALFPRLALPVDFESRYSARQRKLIVLHETIHRKRHDGLANLFMSALLVMQWFNPLVFWAVRALCRDQESACDALIVRRHPTALRDYADAMLKTVPQPSRHLPIVCRWQAFHPTVERIAMLKAHRDLQVQRKWTRSLLLLAVVTSSALVYALKPATVLPESPKQDAPITTIATPVASPLSLKDDATSAIETKATADAIREPAPAHRVRTLVAQASAPAVAAQDSIPSDATSHTHYRLDLLITQTIARDTTPIEMTTNKSEMSVLVRIGESMSYDAPYGLRFTLHPKPAEDKISIGAQIWDIAKDKLVASPRVIAKPNERVSIETGEMYRANLPKNMLRIELTVNPLTAQEATDARAKQDAALSDSKQAQATNLANPCEASPLFLAQSIRQLSPTGIVQKGFFRNGPSTRITGLAQTAAQVSALMAAIGQSADFANPELTSLMRTSDGETASLEFTITLTHRCQPPNAGGAI